ncbi:MAG: tetratricopeptide repeat protein [Gammaproteobacteria bacterium]|nr:tetratricopeptide repeat protein [Gammaproteobacteria bacterium]
MATESIPLLLILLVVAAASGWLVAKLTARRSDSRSATVPPVEFYRGLNHILHDESDKAITLLQSLAQSDSGTAEIHFALGTLFRQRGETDRAIRIHQNLLAKPDLARRYRGQALFALAEDYLKAGLFDRAETLFVQLVEEGVRRADACRKLVSIYERQNDWDQAVETRQRLARLVPGAHDEIIAQYHCERAQQARDANDLAGMRDALKQAQKVSRGVVRGALMRADLAILRNDAPLALKLYRRVLESSPELAAVVLLRLHGCFDPAAPELSRALRDSLKRQPALAGHLARAALATGLTKNAVVAETTGAFLHNHPVLSGLSENLEGNYTELNTMLHSLGLATLSFRCRECGYRATELNWQCPACLEWDSARPEIALTVTD